MCHSMQELPCVESFVIDDTVMEVGSMKDLILWTTVVCKIVELDEWSLCSPSAKGTLMY